jgi:hypothetical protein
MISRCIPLEEVKDELYPAPVAGDERIKIAVVNPDSGQALKGAAWKLSLRR